MQTVLTTFQPRLTVIALLFCVFTVQAQREIPEQPNVAKPVYDRADMLSQNEEARLDRKLANYADTTSTQIVIATIPSLQGEDIAQYATEWAHQWKIGQSEKDNGLFILISKKERQIWMTTGYGLEAYLTDARSKTIIEEVIKPEFKRQNYYAGLDKGTDLVMQVLAGQFEGVENARQNGLPIRFIFILGFFILIVIVMISRKNRGNGRNGGSGSGSGMLFDAIILSSLGRGMFGGGSGGGFSGGGGFGGGGSFGGGFGGGGFGGGGAGGSW